MRYVILIGTAFSVCCSLAQGLHLRAALPAPGITPLKSFYTAVPVPEMLDTAGTRWFWDLMSRTWELGMETADTIWHHSATISPAQGGNFSAYELNEQRYSFFHLNADTLVEDSTWSLTQGTTEIHDPAIPMAWQGQQLGDTLWYFDRIAGAKRMTTLRATLDLKMPWGTVNDLLVFEDRVADYINYRIHRGRDLALELARYVVGDGLYVVWPAE